MKQVKQVTVNLDGCDDYTSFTVELTEEELKVVKKLSELSHKTSTYGCMPTLSLYIRGED